MSTSWIGSDAPTLRPTFSPFEGPPVFNFTHLSSDAKRNVSVSLGLSLLNVVVMIVVVYVYFVHPVFHHSLRSHFNNIVVGCVVVQGMQSLLRAATSGVLLGAAMTQTGCNRLATIDSGLDTAATVLIVGFYYSLLSLRWNPLKRCALMCTSSEETFSRIRRVWWFVVAGIGAISVCTAAGLTSNQSGYFFGWCTPDDEPWIFVVTIFLPMWLIALTAIVTMVVLRCCGGGAAPIGKSLTWRKFWTVYVRFFSIIIFAMISTLCRVVVHFAASDDDRRTAGEVMPIVMQCLWPTVIGFTFLLTEGVFHWWCSSSSAVEEVLPSATSRASRSEMYPGDVYGEYVEEASKPNSPSNVDTEDAPIPGLQFHGFTSAMQNLLVMEVVGGVHSHAVISTRTWGTAAGDAQWEGDYLLARGAAAQGVGGHWRRTGEGGGGGRSDDGRCSVGGTASEPSEFSSPQRTVARELTRAMLGSGSPIVLTSTGGHSSTRGRPMPSDLSDRPEVV